MHEVEAWKASDGISSRAAGTGGPRDPEVVEVAPGEGTGGPETIPWMARRELSELRTDPWMT